MQKKDNLYMLNYTDNKISDKNLEALLGNLQEIEEHQIKAKFKNFQRSNFEQKTNRYLRYAAIIILAIAVGQFINFIPNSNNKKYGSSIINSPIAQFTKLILPDSSLVFLNSGSRVEYNEFGSNNERRIKLIGEAYFEVKKSTSDLFIVEVNSYEFKVYGTKFNIEAYDNSNLIRTTLIEGSLGVSETNESDFARLQPSQQVVIDKNSNKSKLLTLTNPQAYLEWQNGIISFENKSLKDIAQQLERWYNIRIQIKSDKTKQLRFTGSIIKRKPVTQVLEALKDLNKISYKILNVTENTQTIIIN